MNIKHLGYFVEIVSCGSLSQAAERVYVTQSALSRAVSQLEQELECRLLERTTKGVVPTPQGHSLVERAQRILQESQAIAQDVKLPGTALRGRVRLAMPTGLRNRLTRPLVSRLRQAYPQLRIEITETTSRGARTALDEGRVDLAVLTESERAGRLNTVPLYTDRICLVGPGSSALSMGRAVPTATLGTLPLVLLRAPNNLRAVVDRILRRLHVDTPPVLEVSSSPLALSLVADGHGYTVLPRSTVESMAGAAADRHALKLAPLGKLALTWMVALPQDRPVPQGARLMAQVLQELAMQAPSARGGESEEGRNAGTRARQGARATRDPLR
jgi:LysR family nitrogen assimilation transcriptional regulator